MWRHILELLQLASTFSCLFDALGLSANARFKLGHFVLVSDTSPSTDVVSE